jgi:ABC-2 type transport system ATP-binding protein
VPNDIVYQALTQRFSTSGAPALDGIDARIEAGRITGLVGPDAAGKTTLLRLTAGLLVPTAGRVTVGGLDPVRDADRLRPRLGYMPQKFGLYEDLSVLENLTLYADLRGVVGDARRDAFRRVLEFTDLARFTARPAGKLSGGMKQKLGLACVLLGAPDVLLLDEPSVGVDPISRRELWQMVNALAGEGMTIVWSTSYLDEAERCPDILLMSAGRLAYAGAPAALAERLDGRTFQLEGVAEHRRAVLARALRRPEVMDGVIQGRRVRVVLRANREPPPPEALEAGSGVSLVPVAPRLEDAFVDLLGGGPGGDSVLADRLPERPAGGDRDRVIVAEGLTRRFGEFVAADDISFTVPRGEIFGLLGPNGAGKSTTFKMLCGLLTPTRGRAALMGLDLTRRGSEARSRLGYMAQKFSLYGSLSVAQNLAFFSGAYGLGGRTQRERIQEMVDVFELGPYLGTAPDTLPLGYRQRLALACAMMHEPDVLFLDEPTSGVDPITRREFWTHINGVVQKGVTVLVTTHFMDEAEYCDRIGLVYRGRMIAIGTPDDLKASVATGDRPDPTMEDAFISLVERAAPAERAA